MYILTLGFWVIGFGQASEISDRRSAKISKIDTKKDILSKSKSQSAGNIYTVSKWIYVKDTMNVHNMTMGQVINYIKNWQKDCAVETWDIINIMGYDLDFDSYMKVITVDANLKNPVWSAKYYDGQSASCVRVAGCKYRTNKLIDLISNKSLTQANIANICQSEIPELYNRFFVGNEKYYNLTRDKIGNELYINADENDWFFDLLADIKYIWDIIYWGNEDPSKVYIHDIDKLKSEYQRQNDVNASLTNNTNTSFAFEPSTQDLILLAQAWWGIDASSADLLQDPDIKKLLWDSIYNNLKTFGGISESGEVLTNDNSFIKSYVGNLNKSNLLQDKWSLQQAWQKANPVSNSGDALSVTNSSNVNKTNTLKACLKSCLNAKTASDSNMCRNSCLCGQSPKDWWQTWADGKAWSFNSIMVLKYCIQASSPDGRSPQKKKQTIEWLLVEIQDILQTINEKDITPRTISRESFDFDLLLVNFAKEFHFGINTTTKDVPSKCKEYYPELLTQMGKINNDQQNPSSLKLQKMQADLEVSSMINCFIEQNVSFWDNMKKTVDNIKQTAQFLKDKIND